MPATATTSQVVAAINAKTSARVGDVRTSARLNSATVARAQVVAWELGKGATASAAWGAKTTTAQTFFARS